MEIRKRLLAGKYLILVLCLVFFSRLVFAEEEKVEIPITTQPAAEAERKLLINYSNGSLSVEAKDISVKELFDEISKKTGIETFVDSIIKDKLTIKFENLKLKEGLEKIINSIGNKNYGLVYRKGEKDEWGISKVYLIKRLEGVEDEEMVQIVEKLDSDEVYGAKIIMRKFGETIKKFNKKMSPFIIERMKNSKEGLARRDFSYILEKIGDTSIIQEFEEIVEDSKKYVVPYHVYDMGGWKPGGMSEGQYNEMVNILNELKFKKFIEEEKPYERSVEEQVKFWVTAYRDGKVQKIQGGDVQEELIKLGQPAVKLLIEYLKDEDKSGKIVVLYSLIGIGGKIGYKEVLPGIIECLVQKDHISIQNEALDILKRILGKINVEDILKPVSELLNNESESIRKRAGEVLEKIGKDAMPKILEIYDSLNIKGKKNAIEILGNIGDEEAINIIREALEEPELRNVAENALEKIKKGQKE